MPDCFGMTVEEVTGKLTELGITFQLVPNYSAEYDYNVVYNQSVEAETDVNVGDRMNKVLIYYGALESGGSSWKDDDDESSGIIIIDGRG